jgi:hypothetical protein
MGDSLEVEILGRRSDDAPAEGNCVGEIQWGKEAVWAIELAKAMRGTVETPWSLLRGFFPLHLVGAALLGQPLRFYDHEPSCSPYLY